MFSSFGQKYGPLSWCTATSSKHAANIYPVAWLEPACSWRKLTSPPRMPWHVTATHNGGIYAQASKWENVFLPLIFHTMQPVY